MSIRGNLNEASLPDVIQLLSLGKKTGVLSVSDKKNFGDIFFKNGKIIYCSIINRENKIGDMLIKSGDITNEQLNKALEIQEKDSSKRLGDILIEIGAIDTNTLYKRIENQITDTIFIFLTWDEGFFNFEPDIEPLEETITVELEPDDILLEQARKVDEWSLIEDNLPNEKTILMKTGIENNVKLNEDENYVLTLVNNRNSLKEIYDKSKLGRYETGKAIYNLVKIGYIYSGQEKELELLESNQQKIMEHYNLGLAFLLTEMYDEAMREFKHIVEMDKTNTTANFYIGLIYFRTGNYEEALKAFEEILKLGVNNVALFNNIALTLEKLENFERADEFYERGIKLNPENAKLLANYGILSYFQNLLSDAEEKLQMALKINSKLNYARFYLALVYLENGKINNAINEFLEVTKKDPAIWQVYYNIGHIYINLEKYESAEHMLKKAVENSKRNIIAYRALVELYFLEKNFEQAELLIEEIISLYKNDFDMYYKLGNIKYRKGDRKAAVFYWEKALKINPENEILKRTLETVKNG